MVKISELSNLTIVESNDLIPIIDVSETNTALKNKKVDIATLFNNYSSNLPYLDISLTGNLPTNTGENCFILGADSEINGSLASASYNFILGNTNTINSSGETHNFIVGNSNNIVDNVDHALIIGNNSLIYGDSDNSIILGINCKLGRRTQGVATVNSDSKRSIAIGYNSFALGYTNCAIGNDTKVYEGATYGIAIGSNSTIGTSQPVNIVNTYDNVIAIGTDSIATKDFSLAIGCQAISRGLDSIALGYYAEVEDGADNAISIKGLITSSGLNSISIGDSSTVESSNSVALGTSAQVSQGLSNCVQLGTGTLSISNTLQFLNTPIANNKSIQATTQSTGIAPTYIAPNGTIVVDENGTGKVYVRIAGVWRSTNLI